MRMYEGGVPENISEKSGHRGLQAYERTSILQEKAAGASINAEQALCVVTDEHDVQVSPSEKVPQLPTQRY